MTQGSGNNINNVFGECQAPCTLQTSFVDVGKKCRIIAVVTEGNIFLQIFAFYNMVAYCVLYLLLLIIAYDVH
jgi:hypothetical protein